MAQNIDLIPLEERIQQEQEKTRKEFIIFSVSVFAIVLIIFTGLSLYTKNLDEKISELKSSVESKKTLIIEKSDIEVTIRNLDAKTASLSNILQNKNYYSILLDEIAKRVPKTVGINTIDTSQVSQVNISGTAKDYVSLAKFLNSLTQNQSSSESAKLFKEVSISSVTLDPFSSDAKFNLNVTIEPTLLKKL